MTLNKWILIAVAKVVLIAAAIGVVFSLYGCNTVRGMGQDIEKAGEVIQKSAK